VIWSLSPGDHLDLRQLGLQLAATMAQPTSTQRVAARRHAGLGGPETGNLH